MSCCPNCGSDKLSMIYNLNFFVNPDLICKNCNAKFKYRYKELFVFIMLVLPIVMVLAVIYFSLLFKLVAMFFGIAMTLISYYCFSVLEQENDKSPAAGGGYFCLIGTANILFYLAVLYLVEWYLGALSFDLYKYSYFQFLDSTFFLTFILINILGFISFVGLYNAGKLLYRGVFNRSEVLKLKQQSIVFDLVPNVMLKKLLLLGFGYLFIYQYWVLSFKAIPGKCISVHCGIMSSFSYELLPILIIGNCFFAYAVIGKINKKVALSV